jgi:hypothetical protein
MRLPHAGKTLIRQVGEFRPDAESNTGEPDGLGVIREITFDRETGKLIQPLIKDDPRIASAVLGRKGGLVVTFVSGIAADDRSACDIPAVLDDATEQAIADLSAGDGASDDAGETGDAEGSEEGAEVSG